MPNHPNRSRRSNAAAIPSPQEIRAARVGAGQTQTEAGLVLHVGCRNWQKWESGESRMHPAFWELYRIKLPKP